MKHIITLMLLCSILSAKPVNKDKPVYQLDWGVMPPGNMWFGGGWSERQLETYKLTPAERSAIEASANAAMYRKLAMLSWVLVGLAAIAAYVLHWKHGVGVAVISAVFSFASSFMASSMHYVLRYGLVVAGVAVLALCFTPPGKKLFNKLGGKRDRK